MARTRVRGHAAGATCPRTAGRAGVSAPAAGGSGQAQGHTRRDARSRCEDRVVEVHPAAGGELGAVFFQFVQHAHGERDGGADLLGPAFWFLTVPFRDRDQVPADDSPDAGADR
jgi:hypothetical protein